MQMLKIAIILKIAEIFFIVFLCKAILGKKQYQQNIILVCTISFLDKQNNSACLTLQYYLPWNKNSPPWLIKKSFQNCWPRGCNNDNFYQNWFRGSWTTNVYISSFRKLLSNLAKLLHSTYTFRLYCLTPPD